MTNDPTVNKLDDSCEKSAPSLHLSNKRALGSEPSA